MERSELVRKAWESKSSSERLALEVNAVLCHAKGKIQQAIDMVHEAAKPTPAAEGLRGAVEDLAEEMRRHGENACVSCIRKVIIIQEALAGGEGGKKMSWAEIMAEVDGDPPPQKQPTPGDALAEAVEGVLKRYAPGHDDPAECHYSASGLGCLWCDAHTALAKFREGDRG